MPGDSAIQWTEKTWNPVTGCDKVSPGCAHCYAETFAERWRGVPGHPYEQGFDLKLWPERLRIPLGWRKPAMIFVNSMSDLFHEQIPFEYIAAVFGVMGTATRHTFQILTKRPDRMVEFFDWYAARCLENELLAPDEQAMFGVGCARDLQLNGLELLEAGNAVWPLRNVWLGVSIENRRFVDRADLLRATPAAVRFVSAEPLLGPLTNCRCGHAASAHGSRSGLCGGEACQCEGVSGTLDLFGIDWLIVGGESGAAHRQMRPEWARDLRDACLQNGTAFFFKQWGGHRPKSNGRELDGRTWDEMPDRQRVA